MVESVIKRTFVRFFFKSQLFSDGYRVIEGDIAPFDPKCPPMEVKTRNLSELDFFIPDGSVGFILFDTITTQVEDNGEIKELTSGEINRSGRHFFQIENNGQNYGRDFGRVATREEATQAYDKYTYMRRYCRQPVPEKIILYTGGQYYAHDYSFSRAGRHHTRGKSYHICAFDFMETDIIVPVCFIFPHAHMIRAAAEKKGWIKQRAA